MKVENYKDAVNQINVNTNEILDRFKQTTSKSTKSQIRLNNFFNIKHIPVFITSCLLIIVLLVSTIGNGNDKLDFFITVNASGIDEAQTLSKSPSVLSASSKFNIMGTTNDDYGSVNFDLNFICEGEDIESITYKISDELLTRNNKSNAVAFFAENCTYPKGYTAYKTDESVYESMFFNDTWYVKKMIGSSFTVNYNNQDNKKYALEVNFNIDDQENYNAKEFKITVLILKIDQTIIEKSIKVKPTIGNPSDVETLSTLDSLDDFIKIELVLD